MRVCKCLRHCPMTLYFTLSRVDVFQDNKEICNLNTLFFLLACRALSGLTSHTPAVAQAKYQPKNNTDETTGSWFTCEEACHNLILLLANWDPIFRHHWLVFKPFNTQRLKVERKM